MRLEVTLKTWILATADISCCRGLRTEFSTLRCHRRLCKIDAQSADFVALPLYILFVEGLTPSYGTLFFSLTSWRAIGEFYVAGVNNAKSRDFRLSFPRLDYSSTSSPLPLDSYCTVFLPIGTSYSSTWWL